MGTEISVRLNKSQTGLIWTGLNHIVCSYARRERTEKLPRPIHFEYRPCHESSSLSMMNRIFVLCAMLKPDKPTGGTFNLDSFQLRAAAVSARATLQLQRLLATTDKARKSSLKQQKRDGIDPESIKKLSLKKSALVKYMERQMTIS